MVPGLRDRDPPAVPPRRGYVSGAVHAIIDFKEINDTVIGLI